jgi:beta-N-acetylhexosaminidase
MSEAAAALGVRQRELDDALAGFARAARPWAFVLFREACGSRAQVQRLCAALREAAGHDAVIWIDQEGGRVARLTAPEWPRWPPAAGYGALYARDQAAGLEAAELAHRLIAHELKAMGVDGDFAPVLDVPEPGSHAIVGDRAFSDSADAAAALGRAALNGLRAGGVVGCVKHMPGHGRATADSHHELPKVADGANALARDLAPFKALADAEVGMTAHVLFESVDPLRPATHSPLVIERVIRGEIGFDGLLVTDDLDMKALVGPLEQKASRAFAAGCDLALQCSGKVAHMETVMRAVPALAGKAQARAARATAVAKAAPAPFDAAAAWWRLRALLGPAIRSVS